VAKKESELVTKVRQLREADPSISEPVMAKQLGVSRPSVWRALQKINGVERHPFQVGLTDEDFEMLKSLAGDNDEHMSEFIRGLIRDAYAKSKKKPKT
jgi:predicted DNA-binding transcriptional regulator AlpA